MTITNNSRIVSIDILRALTMVLMIFVNDLWTLENIPGWLEHVSRDTDGMGLADTVFPAFLFIVGMSIPFAVQNRRRKGDDNGKITWHILTRSFALLIMGVFFVNGEHINEAASGIKSSVWDTLICISFVLLWNHWPKTMNKWLLTVLKSGAVLVLLTLAWLYKDGHEGNINRFSTYWWGILGLIGWAYLVTALIFMLSRNKLYAAIISWILFLLICAASHAGWIPENSILKHVIGPFGNGAMPAFTMGGVVTTLIFQHFREKNEHAKMMIVLLALAVLLFLLGTCTRTFWGISKIRATPAWVLICSAITIVVFIPVYWLADLKGKANWFGLIKPAGNNTLLCYLLPYFAYAFMDLFHLHLPDALLIGGIGLLKSLLFAIFIVVITGWLGRLGVRMKL